MEPGADLPARRLALVIARVVLTLRHPALVARFAMKPGYLPSPAGYGTWANPVIAERLERLWRLEDSALSQATA